MAIHIAKKELDEVNEIIPEIDSEEDLNISLLSIESNYTFNLESKPSQISEQKRNYSKTPLPSPKSYKSLENIFKPYKRKNHHNIFKYKERNNLKKIFEDLKSKNVDKSKEINIKSDLTLGNANSELDNKKENTFENNNIENSKSLNLNQEPKTEALNKNLQESSATIPANIAVDTFKNEDNIMYTNLNKIVINDFYKSKSDLKNLRYSNNDSEGSLQFDNKLLDDKHEKIESILSQDTVIIQSDKLKLKGLSISKSINKFDEEYNMVLSPKKDKSLLSKEKLYSLYYNSNELNNSTKIKNSVNDAEKINSKDKERKNKIKLNSFFHLLSFFNSEDMKQIFNVSKKIRMLISLSIRDIYYATIIQKIKKNPYFEILKIKIHYSTVHITSMKIDLIVLVRIKNFFKDFFDNEYKNPSINLVLAFVYKSSKREEKGNNLSKFVDYYSLDLFPNDTKIFPAIYMTREFTKFNLDFLQKTYIQPILPFKEEDMAYFNFQIFAPEIFFINPLDIKIKIMSKNIPDKSIFGAHENNMRICEYEDLCNHWKGLNSFKDNKKVQQQIQNIFYPYFDVLNIEYEDIGFMVFKVILKAIEEGKIENKEELGITIKVNKKDDIIVNEVKKNDLLYENRNIYELRKKDVIIFYLTNSK